MEGMEPFSARLCAGVRGAAQGWLGDRWSWEGLGSDRGFVMPHDFVAVVSDSSYASVLEVDLARHGGQPGEVGRITWYNRDQCRKVSDECGLKERVQQALVVGENDRGDVLVLALKACPQGLYRVAKTTLSFGALGVGQAVYLGPNVTGLLCRGLLLERIFVPVSDEADAHERARQVAVEEKLRQMLEEQSGPLPADQAKTRLRLEGLTEAALAAGEDVLLLLASSASRPAGRGGRSATAEAEAQKPLQDRLHPSVEAGRNLYPPASVEEAMSLLRRVGQAVPDDYLNLVCQFSHRPWFYATLEAAGHAGRRRSLSIERPMYCWTPGRWRLEDGQMLPPLLSLGADGIHHRLVHGAQMEPPGLYGVQMVDEDEGVVRVRFLAPTLEEMLTKGVGLAEFFEPRRQCEADQERLNVVASEVRAQIQQEPPPPGVTAEAWAATYGCKSALEHLLSGHLNVEVWDPQDLGEWCQRSQPRSALVLEFKRLLAMALDQPGLVTPLMYEAWTDDSAPDTQAKLQTLFQDLWNLCFPEEPRYDTPVRRAWTSPRVWSREMHERERASYQRRQDRLFNSALTSREQSAVLHECEKLKKEAQAINDPLLESPEWPDGLFEQALRNLGLPLQGKGPAETQ